MDQEQLGVARKGGIDLEEEIVEGMVVLVGALDQMEVGHRIAAAVGRVEEQVFPEGTAAAMGEQSVIQMMTVDWLEFELLPLPD